MSAQHSPAPWTYTTGKSLHGRYHTVEDANHDMICECYDGDDAKNETDAKLIAAAPDLLREGQALLALFIHALNTPSYGKDDEARREAQDHIEMMRAAIAKAGAA